MNDAARRAVKIFGVTSLTAFWVNATGHAWKIWRRDPLVSEHKATLHFRSALLGDAVLLPLVNVLLDHQLEAWGDGLRPGHLRRDRLTRALLVACVITGGVHTFQAAARLTNWSMPRPWRWTPLGYYHAVYMAGQLTVLAYAAAVARARVHDHGSGVLLTRRLLAAIALLMAFAVLVYKDYY